ncbi:transglycosylase family protein [Mycolicibacterium sp.]|uniref:transglycosylase family protein n=1 Tax=Mycolicibacterium sp. TaxID=2320850 RepID=UPI0037C72AA2
MATPDSGAPGKRDDTFAIATVIGKKTGRLPNFHIARILPRESVLRVGAQPGTEVPAVSNGDRWNAIVARESVKNWAISTGNGYYGNVKLDQSTLGRNGSVRYAVRTDLATTEKLIVIAEMTRARQVWSSWPVCGGGA